MYSLCPGSCHTYLCVYVFVVSSMISIIFTNGYLQTSLVSPPVNTSIINTFILTLYQK